MIIVYKSLSPCSFVTVTLLTMTIAQRQILHLLTIALTPCLKSQVKQEVVLFHKTLGKCLAHLLLRSGNVMVKIIGSVFRVGKFAPRMMGWKQVLVCCYCSNWVGCSKEHWWGHWDLGLVFCLEPSSVTFLSFDHSVFTRWSLASLHIPQIFDSLSLSFLVFSGENQKNQIAQVLTLSECL